MKITAPKELAPGLFFIGHPGVLLYLIKGRQQSCLVDCGMTVMGPLLRRELNALIGGIAQLDLLALTHSHYDHVGCVSLLLRERPGLKIAAHPALADIVERPNAIALIRQLNQTLMGGAPPANQPDMAAVETFAVTEKLQDGAVLDLGGLALQALYTPGHTRDSLTYYLPQAKAIICGEAAGVPDMQDRIMPEFLQSYADYMASLERLAKLDLEIIGLPHNYVLTGEPAKTYVARSIAASIVFKDRILAALDRAHGEQSAVVKELTTEIYAAGHGQPRDAFALNLTAMVKTIAREFS